MRTGLGWLVVVLVASVALVAASSTQSADVRFETARKKAFVDGDLKGAIAEYDALIAANSTDRAFVARALLLMAECHEKLGDAQSRALLDRIVRDYPDQTEVAGRARVRLASRAGAVTADRLSHRVAWSAPAEADVHGKISPDGRYLPFRSWAASGNLFLRDLNTGVDRRMTAHDDKQGIEYAEGSAFSRDGQQLAFAWRIRSRDVYQLRIVSVAGTANARPRIAFDNEDVKWLAPYDWTPDGKWMAVLLQRKDRTAQIALVSAGDGTVRTLKSVAWDGVSNMAFSPDGRELAFDLRGADAGSRDVFVLAVDGSRETPAAAFQGDDSLVGWSPEGQLLFVSNRTGFTGLWTLPMKDGKPQAAPVLLKRDVGRFWPAGVTTSGAIYSAVLSPPGAQLHLARLDANRPQSAPDARVLDEFVGGTSLLWSQDGESLAYASQWIGMQPRTPGLLDLLKLRFVVASARTGERRELRPSLTYINQFEWTADGRGFYAAGADVQGGKGVYHIDAQTGTTRQLARVLAHEETQLAGIWTEQRDKLYYLRIVTANQVTKLVEHDLRTGTDRDLYPYEPRPNRDVAAIAGDRVFRLLTTRATTVTAAPGPDQVTTLVSSALAGGGTKELLRAVYPDALTLLDWSPDRAFGLFAKTLQAQGRSELWRVPLDDSEPTKLATVADLSSFACGGWTNRETLYCTRNAQGASSELWRLTMAGDLTSVQAIQPASAYRLRPNPVRTHLAYLVPDPAAERPLEVWVLENARPSAGR